MKFILWLVLGLSLFASFDTSAAILRHECKNGVITLENALALERSVNLHASGLGTPFARAANIFGGLENVPSDVRIVSGPVRRRVTFPADIKTLPTQAAEAYGGVLPPYLERADCVVVTLNGERWLASFNAGGHLSYIPYASTEEVP